VALFTLLHLLLVGLSLGIRKGKLRTRTLLVVFVWFAAVHLALGIVLAVRGVEPPKANFESKRAL
jgi:hypothetical protein